MKIVQEQGVAKSKMHRARAHAPAPDEHIRRSSATIPRPARRRQETLFELLDPLIAEGQKVLVFSHSCRCSNCWRRNNLTHILTGATKDRQQVVSAFQADPNAGVFHQPRRFGTGLNLTSSSYVVLYDPWWNPATKRRAIDRLAPHRLVTATVNAYRLIAPGTRKRSGTATEQGERLPMCSAKKASPAVAGQLRI